MCELETFIHNDIIKHGSQDSWDWDADLRLAKHLKEDTLIEEAIESNAPLPSRIAVSKTWRKLTQKRLRVLRRLVASGHCKSFWAGTGQLGRTDFGVSRVRRYAAI